MAKRPTIETVYAKLRERTVWTCKQLADELGANYLYVWNRLYELCDDGRAQTHADGAFVTWWAT